ncbi:MAG: 50S ribosomal protein L32 [Candidatus Kapabacteria bacterium]|nr:50S ribosomal protein L32 [Candidatus Kapabacteria bacterium]MCS7169743.1 50S ribosomal protein L32 [Candidatus Kapabacteria bacterium]MDW7997733.1 50S ribosomal protein L32 [Bacteroidota bacterium]MDW8225622.1 50S ribosomal protein L32 [Bacteroidota bacterium]
MPNPKRRHSRSRRDKRRTHYKHALLTHEHCPQCGEIKEPHRACPSCGFYRGRRVVVL